MFNKEQAKRQHIILENIDFTWDTETISDVVKMWKEEKPLKDIAKAVGRNKEDTFCLLLDLSMKGSIKKRKNYIWGNQSVGISNR